MRWESVQVKPPKDGQYYTWSPKLGKCVMGFVDGSWGNNLPLWWLENDGNPHQNPDGSFDNR